MKLNKLHNLKNSTGDIIILDQEKKTLKIKSKHGEALGILDYSLVPREAIKMLENRNFIRKR